MNPLKMLGKTLPELGKVLESIHAYLELMVEEQKKTNEKLDKIMKK